MASTTGIAISTMNEFVDLGFTNERTTKFDVDVGWCQIQRFADPSAGQRQEDDQRANLRRAVNRRTYYPPFVIDKLYLVD